MDDEKLKTLYGHWVIADAVKYAARQPVKEIPESLGLVRQFSRFMVLRVWYALLYVVVEGYRDLRLSNSDVDALLAQEDMVDALRLFRNSTFHAQENPLTKKHTTFLYAEGSEIWIGQLNRAFEKFFEETSPVKEYVQRAKAVLREQLGEAGR